MNGESSSEQHDTSIGAKDVDELNPGFTGGRDVTTHGVQSPLAYKRVFRCHECHYTTDRKNNLKRHVITMHERCCKSLECCGHVFPNKASLRDHVTLRHKNGYDCLICGRNFCRKALLKRHVTVHNGKKDYACNVCGYATSHKSNLERHKRRHLPKELRYQFCKPVPSVQDAMFAANQLGLTLSACGRVSEALRLPLPVMQVSPAKIMPGSSSGKPKTSTKKVVKIKEPDHEYNYITPTKPDDTINGNPLVTREVVPRDLPRGGNAASADDSACATRPKIWNPVINDDYRYTSKPSTHYPRKLPSFENNYDGNCRERQPTGRVWKINGATGHATENDGQAKVESLTSQKQRNGNVPNISTCGEFAPEHTLRNGSFHACAVMDNTGYRFGVSCCDYEKEIRESYKGVPGIYADVLEGVKDRARLNATKSPQNRSKKTIVNKFQVNDYRSLGPIQGHTFRSKYESISKLKTRNTSTLPYMYAAFGDRQNILFSNKFTPRFCFGNHIIN